MGARARRSQAPSVADPRQALAAGSVLRGRLRLPAKNIELHSRDPGPTAPGQHGVFTRPVNARRTIAEAIERARRGYAWVSQKRGGTEIIVDMGRPIGFLGGRAGAVAGHPPTRLIRLLVRSQQIAEAHPYYGLQRAGGPMRRAIHLQGGRRRVRGILFDLDGTLADSRNMLAHTARDAARAIGVRVALNRARELVDGRGFREMVQAIKPNASPADVDSFRTHWVDAESRHRDKIRLLPGVEADLQRFQDAGLRLGVATARSPREAREILRQLGITRFFRVITGSGETGVPNKPAPDLIHGASSAMGLRARDILMVGDTTHDIHAAHAAGMPAAAVRWGMGGRALESAGADHISDGLRGVVRTLDPVQSASSRPRPH